MDSLNEIRLSTDMLTSLYGRSLVSPVDNTYVKTKAPAPHVALKFLGNNRKNTTILVNNPGHTFLPENDLSFLTKILEACRMNIGDVAIVNTHGNSHPMEQLVAELHTKILIHFGAPDEHFTIAEKDGYVYLPCPAVNAFTADTAAAKQLKGRLWAALKQVFRL